MATIVGLTFPEKQAEAPAKVEEEQKQEERQAEAPAKRKPARKKAAASEEA